MCVTGPVDVCYWSSRCVCVWMCFTGPVDMCVTGPVDVCVDVCFWASGSGFDRLPRLNLRNPPGSLA